MKKLMFILFIGLTSCTMKEYKYEIHGKVNVSTSGTNQMRDAIWLTDTISFDGDTAYYFNSDGSQVRISPPYTLIDKSLNKR